MLCYAVFPMASAMQLSPVVVESARAAPPPAGLPGGLIRRRYQLAGGLPFAVVLPFVLRPLLTSTPMLAFNSQATAVGSIIAVIGGYALYKKLDVFPGVNAGRSILPAFSICFGVVMAVFLVLRLRYSSGHFLIAYGISVLWFTAVELLLRRRRSYTLAIVPGGDAHLARHIPGVTWVDIADPSSTSRGWNGVVADLHADLTDEWQRKIADCALKGFPVFHVQQVVEQLTGRVEIRHFSENTLGSLNPDQAYIKIKGVFDWIVAAVTLVYLAPLLLAVAVAIRIDSPGPVLFRQHRTGFRGKHFRVYKFRTMRHSSDPEADGDGRSAAMTLDDDHRITRVGRFLRRSRIDELPQILNILRGEMSWVGPRPEAIALTKWYEAEIPFYHYRHIIRPGITGWAQVNQGHVAEVEDVRDKLHYDFYYIKNFSFWLDMTIALQTIKIVLTGHGAR